VVLAELAAAHRPADLGDPLDPELVALALGRGPRHARGGSVTPLAGLRVR